MMTNRDITTTECLISHMLYYMQTLYPRYILEQLYTYIYNFFQKLKMFISLK